jgi:hypothetical protein
MARNRFLLLAALILSPSVARAYVEAPFTLGKVVQDSTNILVIQVQQVDKEKNLIVYRKVRDLKGTHPGDTIKHNIGRGGFHPREWQNIMAWAEVGRIAVFFHNGGASETCIDNYWYQTYAGEWWGLSHAEPFLLRSFAGKPERLATALTTLLAGQEVVVPCMVDGDKNALHLRTAKVMRMKASLKLQDYNAARDFAGWGVEEFRVITDMPGFSHQAALARVDPGALGVACTDFNGDGKPDLCLYGASRVVLLQNAGGSLNDVPLGLPGGARAAAWADYDGDGKPDLLLATPTGPKLLLNAGEKFVDATAGLPRQDYYNLTAAAWIDYDGDKRPDILLADGFRGLRLYRNKAAALPAAGAPKPGAWYYIGPFDNPDGKGFDTAYPPETEFDLKKEYVGKANEKVTWKPGNFPDGQANNLALFKPELNAAAAVYLYREFEVPAPAELPISLGSDDTLTVWLNGTKLLAEKVDRACAPDQNLLKLNLKAGKNALLLKVCNGSGEFAFYFAAKEAAPIVPPLFEDVSDAVGLGANGAGGRLKGDCLLVADVNGDGRPDILYSAGTGLLILNTPQGFVEATDAGIAYQPGGVTPALGDFDGDGAPDLFVPQPGKCKLFRNDGKGHFTDVTRYAGDVGKSLPLPTVAVWADFQNRGRADLLVACLKGPNRFFRNNGDGSFTDATDEIGLDRRIFSSQALAALDLNGDRVLDCVFINEGQESTILLGNPARLAPTPTAGARVVRGR